MLVVTLILVRVVVVVGSVMGGLLVVSGLLVGLVDGLMLVL